MSCSFSGSLPYFYFTLFNFCILCSVLILIRSINMMMMMMMIIIATNRTFLCVCRSQPRTVSFVLITIRWWSKPEYKTAEQIEMSFGVWTRVGARNQVLRGGPHPPVKEALGGIFRSITKYGGHSYSVGGSSDEFALSTAATCFTITLCCDAR